MKKWILFLAAAMAAGAVSAQVYSEDFTSLTLISAGTASFPDVHPVTTSSTDGILVKGGSVSTNNGVLHFVRPADYGGLSASAMMLDGTLFTDGAGTYTLSFDFVYAMLGANRLYLELYDVDFGAGYIEVPTVYWATSYGTNLPPVSTFDGASASLLIKHKYWGGDQNQTHSLDFEYDGSGDVLFRLGAGRENINEWWTLDVDNLAVVSPPPPADPTDLSVIAGNKRAYLQWSSSSEPDVTYNVYRSTTPGVYGAPIATGLTDAKYYDAPLTNSIIYYYAVTAVSMQNKESGYSGEDSAIPQPYVLHSTKKGVGSGSNSRVQALNASWYYNWGIGRASGVDPAIEYVPMRHNKQWAPLTELTNIGEFTHFLGYNEPEDVNQGNITVAEALAQWPSLEGAVVTYGNEALMGSPATANPADPWIIDFMADADPMGYKVDFMTMHKYPTPVSSGSILNGAQWYHDTYNRDVWITEFNAADWTGPNDYTQEQSYTWMIEVLFRMESTSYIKRYAIFPWDGSSSVSAASPVFEPGGNILTPLGKLYAEYRTADVNGPYADTWYYLHNKSSKERLYNSSDTPATTDIFTEGVNANFKVVDAGNGNHFIVKRDSSGKRLGYNGSSLVWAASTVSDSWVQWNIADEIMGWDFINHPDTGMRLSGNPLSVVSGATTNDSVRWAFVRANPLPTDVDGDDLPDTWEVEQLGSIVGSAGGSDNYDGDRDADAFEYLAGTLAGNSNSYFQTPLTDFGGGTIEVTFEAITNRMYVLATTEELSTNTIWSVRNIAIPPTNGINSLRYTAPGDPPKLFGRVGILELE